ncbi:MAG: hypothetical protein FWC50_13000 [Planctomycetaceae bacterium]|nr:hypothetical protein [Planctomycetaceae bacterium]
MLTFFGKIEEADISAYAGTLLLPSYMSHLRLTPFRFANQPRQKPGESNLVLTYIGPGRVEEIRLSPKENALELLCYTCRGLLRDKIKLPDHGGIWNVPVMTRNPCPGKPETPVVILPEEEDVSDNDIVPLMRLFFQPVKAELGMTTPIPFAPDKAYFSISRKELFLHRDVIVAYFAAWFNELGLETQSSSQEILCVPTSCGYEISTPFIAVEWAIEPDEIFQDVLRFAGLAPGLNEWENSIQLKLDSPETQMTDRGLLVPLEINKPFSKNERKKQ